MGLRADQDGGWKILTPPEFDPQTVQSIASRYPGPTEMRTRSISCEVKAAGD